MGHLNKNTLIRFIRDGLTAAQMAQIQQEIPVLLVVISMSIHHCFHIKRVQEPMEGQGGSRTGMPPSPYIGFRTRLIPVCMVICLAFRTIYCFASVPSDVLK